MNANLTPEQHAAVTAFVEALSAHPLGDTYPRSTRPWRERVASAALAVAAAFPGRTEWPYVATVSWPDDPAALASHVLATRADPDALGTFAGNLAVAWRRLL